ncbi:MAG: HEPN domain-containing protein [Acidobacteriota bacterium]
MSLLDEWISKAETDYKSAVALNRRRREPLPDAVCYHCQQCLEKYLKAYLTAHGVTPPRIHDLEDLLELCAVCDTSLRTHSPLVRALNPYGVLIRYPGMTATVPEANDAVRIVRRLRVVLRRGLGLR